MDIIINYVDGSCSEYKGMADHISIESHLDALGFEIFEEIRVPKWCDNSNALCIRDNDGEYDVGEYDVAELVDNGGDDGSIS